VALVYLWEYLDAPMKSAKKSSTASWNVKIEAEHRGSGLCDCSIATPYRYLTNARRCMIISLTVTCNPSMHSRISCLLLYDRFATVSAIVLVSVNAIACSCLSQVFELLTRLGQALSPVVHLELLTQTLAVNIQNFSDDEEMDGYFR